MICTETDDKMHFGILFSQTVNLHEYEKSHQNTEYFERFPTPDAALTQPNKLKYYRLKNQLSKAAVAKYLGCTENNYARYECTEHGFSSLWLILKLSQLYGIDPYLLADEYHSFLLKGQAVQIKAFRKQHGFTQEQLANMLGVSRNTVKRWEKEKDTITRLNFEVLRRYMSQLCSE